MQLVKNIQKGLYAKSTIKKMKDKNLSIWNRAVLGIDLITEDNAPTVTWVWMQTYIWSPAIPNLNKFVSHIEHVVTSYDKRLLIDHIAPYAPIDIRLDTWCYAENNNNIGLLEGYFIVASYIKYMKDAKLKEHEISVLSRKLYTVLATFIKLTIILVELKYGRKRSWF